MFRRLTRRRSAIAPVVGKFLRTLRWQRYAQHAEQSRAYRDLPAAETPKAAEPSPVTAVAPAAKQQKSTPPIRGGGF